MPPLHFCPSSAQVIRTALGGRCDSLPAPVRRSRGGQQGAARATSRGAAPRRPRPPPQDPVAAGARRAQRRRRPPVVKRGFPPPPATSRPPWSRVRSSSSYLSPERGAPSPRPPATLGRSTRAATAQGVKVARAGESGRRRQKVGPPEEGARRNWDRSGEIAPAVHGERAGERGAWPQSAAPTRRPRRCPGLLLHPRGHVVQRALHPGEYGPGAAPGHRCGTARSGPPSPRFSDAPASVSVASVPGTPNLGGGESLGVPGVRRTYWRLLRVPQQRHSSVPLRGPVANVHFALPFSSSPGPLLIA